MRIHSIAAAVLGWMVLVAAPAHAQHLPFERSFDVTGTPKLAVSTMRGKIDVTTGDTARVVVSGTVTVRIGLDVPANAALHRTKASTSRRKADPDRSQSTERR